MGPAARRLQAVCRMKPYYADESVTIYNGDARELVPNLQADMILTDPPYGLDVKYGRSELGHRTIAGDQDTELLTWISRVGGDVLPATAWMVVFCGFSAVGEVQAALRAGRFDVKTVGVWDKAAPGLGMGIRNQYEMWVLARKGSPPEPWGGGNVWRIPGVHGRPIHPHEKPVELLRRFVARYSQPGDLILDPFMGSGTTLRAAKDLGRKAIGIEIDEAHCEAAANRCRQEVLGLEDPAA